MSNKIIIILFLCFLYSCQEKNNPKERIADQNKWREDSALNFVMKKFGLPYPQQNTQPDSNSLVLYCLRSFDSSFLIHLKQESSGISGVYYIEMPSYYNVTDSGARENQLLFFEGYSFILDSAKWQIIKAKAEELLADTSYKNSSGCRDCKEYGLSYNFKSKNDNGTKYDPFYRFLNELFLDNLIRKRNFFAGKENNIN